jgi:hypothetical protein
MTVQISVLLKISTHPGISEQPALYVPVHFTVPANFVICCYNAVTGKLQN